MTPENRSSSIKPKVLTQKQREFYFENGYILLEKLLPDSWIERLRSGHRRDGRQEPQRHQVGRGLGPRQGPHGATTRACAGCPA